MARGSDSVKDFIDFLNNSPSPFHAVDSAATKLKKAGFKHLKERDSWASACEPGGKYYLTRNGSTIVAFAIGKRWKPGNPIAMVGTHTDSPVLRLKPVSKKQGEGFLQVGVETYGGGLWHTWFDRDLGLAGRAMVKGKDGTIRQKLLHLDRPRLVSAEMQRQKLLSADETADEKFTPLKAINQRHHPYLINLISEEVGADPEDVMDFEVILCDTQKACLGGLHNEFIRSARLDNLNSTYCAVESLIGSVADSSALDDESSMRLIACFDNEEVGSETAQGADSSMLPGIVRRLSVLPAAAFNDADSDKSYDRAGDSDASTAYEQTLAASFLLSSDVEHAVNPNYSSSYESDHKPAMNQGPGIKINANARYATNSPGIALLQEVARKAPKVTEMDPEGVPLQLFVVRNDFRCGSTIGPMLSSVLGARTLDLGNPVHSMHSIRETGGSVDIHHLIRLFSSFFTNYSALEKTISVD
ncbi:MAG: hypothetical protein Q9227_002483 [Pyrenula ochraceoflavens]